MVFHNIQYVVQLYNIVNYNIIVTKFSPYSAYEKKVGELTANRVYNII